MKLPPLLLSDANTKLTFPSLKYFRFKVKRFCNIHQSHSTTRQAMGAVSCLVVSCCKYKHTKRRVCFYEYLWTMTNGNGLLWWPRDACSILCYLCVENVGLQFSLLGARTHGIYTVVSLEHFRRLIWQKSVIGPIWKDRDPVTSMAPKRHCP